MTTATTNAHPQSTNSSIWIVQRQYYYYSDEYCTTASDPDGWFTTELAAKAHSFKKNRQVLKAFHSDYGEDNGLHRKLASLLESSEEEQFDKIMSPTFDAAAFGISYDYNLDWYEVVKLDCLA